jgi:predicted 2-oxoglutarate/Fe(II)-dependent dioxygenase YbiX
MPLSSGQPAPWFTAPTPSNPEFVFDSAAGRYVLMLFLPLEAEARVAALRALAANQPLFDDVRTAAFVVVRDPEAIQGLQDLRGLRWILDAEGAVSRRFAAEEPHWLLLDPTLRVLAAEGMAATEALFQRLRALPPPAEHAGAPTPAPVLIAPRIFEPELCRRLIDLHRADGGAFTGVMRDVGERTLMVMDELKVRRDILVREPGLQAAIRERLEQRLFPLIERAFGFAVTRIERYLVSCYDAGDKAVFHPHRDNTTFATAHRKFACSLNLNDDFEGGDLRFAEFGPATYRAPAGGAAVFACGLMHEATRVTAGRRYAFLPFFYDEAGQATLDAYSARTGPSDLAGSRAAR